MLKRMLQDDLETQYTPSRFTQRFPDRQDLLDHFFNFASKGA